MKKVINYLWAGILLAACQVGNPSPGPTTPSTSAGASNRPLPRVSVSPASLASPITPALGMPSPQASLTAISTSGLTAPQEGLEAYYAFEGNADSQDRKHNGLVQDGTQFKEGINKQSAYFPYASIDDTGISFIKDHLPVQLSKSFTISVWVKPAPDPQRTGKVSMPILCTTGLNEARFGLFWTPGGTDVFMNKKGSDELWLHREKSPRPELKDNIWYQTTVSYNGQQLRVYLDGKLELTQPYSSNLEDHGLIGEFGSCAAVGRDHDPFRLYSLEGYIDELRIYSRVLTDAEVQALYQFDKGGSP